MSLREAQIGRDTIACVEGDKIAWYKDVPELRASRAITGSEVQVASAKHVPSRKHGERTGSGDSNAVQAC